MVKVREYLQDALTEIGVMDPTMSLDANMANHALRVLNRMLESWSNENLLIYTEERQELALTMGKQDYTLGSNAYFNFERPVVITRASIMLTGNTPNVEVPIPILNTQEWQQYAVKTVSGGFPTAVYITGDYPLQKLIFWPVPNVTCSLVLYYWGQLYGFTSINDDVELPKGYAEAIVSNLAMRLCPTYGREVPQMTAMVARTSKERLYETNGEPIWIGADPALTLGSSNTKAIRTFGYIVD
jgi:hypothetical protein